MHQSLDSRLCVDQRLWDWERGSEAALLPTTSGLPPTAAATKAPVIMCRSCCFSPDKPDAIFSVQSGPRGSAYVTEWRYALRQDSTGGGEGVLYDVKPVKVSLASPHPATSLSVRDDGTRLAVGNVEGTVLVYRLPGFAKVNFNYSSLILIFAFKRRTHAVSRTFSVVEPRKLAKGKDAGKRLLPLET